jgi:hypothetical protein
MMQATGVFSASLAGPLLARLAPASQGLDYGCGPGPALAAMLAEAGHAVALYDPLFHRRPAGAGAAATTLSAAARWSEHFHQAGLTSLPVSTPCCGPVDGWA